MEQFVPSFVNNKGFYHDGTHWCDLVLLKSPPDVFATFSRVPQERLTLAPGGTFLGGGLGGKLACPNTSWITLPHNPFWSREPP